MQWIKVGSPCGVFICQHDCYLCRQSGTRLWEPIPGPKTLTQTMGFAAGLLKALKCQEICLNNFHPSLSRIWPYLDFDNPATRDKPASSYRSEACIFFFFTILSTLIFPPWRWGLSEDSLRSKEWGWEWPWTLAWCRGFRVREDHTTVREFLESFQMGGRVTSNPKVIVADLFLFKIAFYHDFWRERGAI